MKQKNTVTVLTVTRGRPDLLQRCIESVKQQDYTKVRHLILIDGCDESYEALRQQQISDETLTWFLRSRAIHERSGPEHLAHLRNLMIRMATSHWVCFLDDDNEYEPNHISELIGCAHRTGSLAVHSWTQLFYFDGTPYLEQRWPWCREDKLAGERYREMVQRGSVSPGSNILCEGVHNFPYRCVDTSAWMLHRGVFCDNPMTASFSYEEWKANKAEDDKLMAYMLKKKIPIVCNRKASLRYYLGGYSNNHDEVYTHSENWEWAGNN